MHADFYFGITVGGGGLWVEDIVEAERTRGIALLEEFEFESRWLAGAVPGGAFSAYKSSGRR